MPRERKRRQVPIGGYSALRSIELSQLQMPFDCPAPGDAIRYWPVSKRINDVRAPRNDKTLIEPLSLEPLESTLLI